MEIPARYSINISPWTIYSVLAAASRLSWQPRALIQHHVTERNGNRSIPTSTWSPGVLPAHRPAPSHHSKIWRSSSPRSCQRDQDEERLSYRRRRLWKWHLGNRSRGAISDGRGGGNRCLQFPVSTTMDDPGQLQLSST